ncbi:uncharacterized protein LOC122505058 isoform X1 [Leptopilina heterotoma]|uniref:uncharacterized protein LOC122505058 isoform X1 n=1 Tax=Leptopilina heterotoma TaxID=63436 RepID=UPI001CA9CBF3|nr:uncharacterized protein LOC122505058 isoform X1 [Leptopilina heterotoma]
MKRAIYSLLLRQYNPTFDSHSSNNPERHCFFASLRKNEMIAKVKEGITYRNAQFRLCYPELKDVIAPETEIDNNSLTLVYTKLTFSKYYQVLNIKEITDDNRDLYVILPETNYRFSDPYRFMHNKMFIQMLPMQITEVNDILGVLVHMANAIENLKTKEENYLKNL